MRLFFRLMFTDDFGVVNKLLETVGIGGISWFTSPTAAMAVIIMAVTWRWAGYNAIIILAGLQSVPEDVYEAATLERISKVKQFFYITLPLLKPIITFCAVMSIIGAMQLFAEPFLITDRGGPGSATETLGVLLYRQGFTSGNFGYASTIAYAIAALAVVISMVQLWLTREPEMSKSRQQRLRAIGLHALLIPLALIWVFPLWMMAVFATLPDHAIFSPNIVLWFGTSFFDNISNLQADTDFLRAMFVSIVVGIIYTILSVMLTAMAGWALVRYRFFGKSLVLAILLGTITLPYFVVVIPQFVMVARDFGLGNTWFALIGPPLFYSLGVLFMRQAFTMMPAELFDAARVEGVSEWRIFFRVALPLARPTMAALSIILFLYSWNNYLWPLLISSDRTMFTAPVALGSLIGPSKVSWGGIMAGAVLLTAPMIAVFLLLQRHFVAGITAGAVK